MKGIAGFYYVMTEDGSIYECKAKGNFRNRGLKPLVGDEVRMEITSSQEKTGNVTEILERRSELIRPEVSNVDQAVIVFAMNDPEPNFMQLDRFLLRMEFSSIPVAICFNKTDLAEEGQEERIRSDYEATGYPLYFICTRTGEGLEELAGYFKDHCTVLAGPSGVGKSTLTNKLAGEGSMETGSISEKNKRGKHTTRHAQLIRLEGGGFIMDTPGFTSLTLDDMKDRRLCDGYPEMRPEEPYCRFSGCSHISEPDCGIKDAVEAGRISRLRYDNYVMIYKEFSQMKKY